MLTPVLSAELIDNSHDAVDAIKTAAGLTDAQFAALCIPVLRAYGDYVQRLPLSTLAFGSPNGAWEFGLTSAMVAYRYAGTVIFFPTLGAEERRLLEPQCRYMALLATLSTAVATVAESSLLVAGDDEYHPLTANTTLFTWLNEHESPRFTWRVPTVPLSAQGCAAIASNFIPKRLLANFDLRAVLMMYEAVNPKTTMNGVESTLARVVREAVQGVLAHYKMKQAGTFHSDPGAIGISPADASNVANKLIAVANPVVLRNPLDAPATSSALTAPQSIAPSTQTPVNAPLESHASAGVPEAPSQPPSPPTKADHVSQMQSAPEMSRTTGDAEERLARGHKVLREWFSSLKQHPQFPVLKEQLVMSDEGVEVPVSLLGMFGVSGATVRKMMDDAGLILGRTANARGVILHPGLRDRFITQ